MGTFLLENAACLSKMYGHYISQVLTKMWELVIFVRDQHHFLLDIKQKAGWLVGIYEVGKQLRGISGTAEGVNRLATAFFHSSGKKAARLELAEIGAVTSRPSLRAGSATCRHYLGTLPAAFCMRVELTKSVVGSRRLQADGKLFPPSTPRTGVANPQVSLSKVCNHCHAPQPATIAAHSLLYWAVCRSSCSTLASLPLFCLLIRRLPCASLPA